MNRRGFLQIIAPAAGLLVVPELLIPKRSFFLPPKGGWYELQWQNDHMITVEEFQERYINPATQSLARQFDQEFMKAAFYMWFTV